MALWFMQLKHTSSAAGSAGSSSDIEDPRPGRCKFYRSLFNDCKVWYGFYVGGTVTTGGQYTYSHHILFGPQGLEGSRTEQVSGRHCIDIRTWQYAPGTLGP